MNDRRIDSLDPADAAFINKALLAGREDLPDDARLRAIEGRLGSALEAESALSGWWTRSRMFPIVGVAALALGVGAMTSITSPSRSVATPAPIAAPKAELVPAATADIDSTSTSPTATIAVDSLPAAPSLAPEAAEVAKATSAHEAKPRVQPAAIATTTTSARSDELALLEEASRELDTSPARALALTDEHQSRFRSPKFAQERERLAVVALLRLGRRDDAKRRADAFEAAFPESAHLARIRELVR